MSELKLSIIPTNIYLQRINTDLQQQQLIELIRESRVEDAIRFASEQLAERGEEDPAVLEELERTLALLAFEDPHQSPFSDLLSHSHRQKVIRI